MADNFIVNRGLESKIIDEDKESGAIWLTEDGQNLYLDSRDGQKRIHITDVIDLTGKSPQDLPQFYYPNKLYIDGYEIKKYNKNSYKLETISTLENRILELPESIELNIDLNNPNEAQFNTTNIVPLNGTIVIDKNRNVGIVKNVVNNRAQVSIIYHGRDSFNDYDIYFDSNYNGPEFGTNEQPFSNWMTLINKYSTKLKDENCKKNIYLKANSTLTLTTTTDDFCNLSFQGYQANIQIMSNVKFDNCKYLTFKDIIITNNSTTFFTNCNHICLQNVRLNKNDLENGTALTLYFNSCSNINIKNILEPIKIKCVESNILNIYNCSHVKEIEDTQCKNNVTISNSNVGTVYFKNPNNDAHGIFTIINSTIQANSFKVLKFEKINLLSGTLYKQDDIQKENVVCSFEGTTTVELGTFNFNDIEPIIDGNIIYSSGLSSIQVHDDKTDRHYGRPRNNTLEAHLDAISDKFNSLPIEDDSGEIILTTNSYTDIDTFKNDEDFHNILLTNPEKGQIYKHVGGESITYEIGIPLNIKSIDKNETSNKDGREIITYYLECSSINEYKYIQKNDDMITFIFNDNDVVYESNVSNVNILSDNTIKCEVLISDKIKTYIDKNITPNIYIYKTIIINPDDRIICLGSSIIDKVSSSNSSLEGYINVKDCGAKGDGVTDDYKILQDIFNEAKDKGINVYFPKGTYCISQPLTLFTGEYISHIIGYKAMIKPINKDYTDYFKTNGIDRTYDTINTLNNAFPFLLNLKYCYNITIEGLCFNGDHRASGINILKGTAAWSSQLWNLSGILIYNCFKGIEMSDTYYGQLGNQVRIRDCMYGIILTGGEVNNIDFINVNINRGASYGSFNSNVLSSYQNTYPRYNGEEIKDYNNRIAELIKLEYPNIGIALHCRAAFNLKIKCSIEGMCYGIKTIPYYSYTGDGTFKGLINIRDSYFEKNSVTAIDLLNNYDILLQEIRIDYSKYMSYKELSTTDKKKIPYKDYTTYDELNITTGTNIILLPDKITGTITDETAINHEAWNVYINNDNSNFIINAGFTDDQILDNRTKTYPEIEANKCKTLIMTYNDQSYDFTIGKDDDQCGVYYENKRIGEITNGILDFDINSDTENVNLLYNLGIFKKTETKYTLQDIKNELSKCTWTIPSPIVRIGSLSESIMYKYNKDWIYNIDSCRFCPTSSETIDSNKVCVGQGSINISQCENINLQYNKRMDKRTRIISDQYIDIDKIAAYRQHIDSPTSITNTYKNATFEATTVMKSNYISYNHNKYRTSYPDSYPRFDYATLHAASENQYMYSGNPINLIKNHQMYQCTPYYQMFYTPNGLLDPVSPLIRGTDNEFYAIEINNGKLIPRKVGPTYYTKIGYDAIELYNMSRSNSSSLPYKLSDENEKHPYYCNELECNVYFIEDSEDVILCHLHDNDNDISAACHCIGTSLDMINSEAEYFYDVVTNQVHKLDKTSLTNNPNARYTIYKDAYGNKISSDDYKIRSFGIEYSHSIDDLNENLIGARIIFCLVDNINAGNTITKIGYWLFEKGFTEWKDITNDVGRYILNYNYNEHGASIGGKCTRGKFRLHSSTDTNKNSIYNSYNSTKPYESIVNILKSIK